MTAPLVDYLLFFAFSGALTAVAAVGILALPWQDEEMEETVEALRAAGRLFERMAHHAGDGVRRLEPVERGTHVFEPPTMPAA